MTTDNEALTVRQLIATIIDAHVEELEYGTANLDMTAGVIAVILGIDPQISLNECRMTFHKYQRDSND